MRRAGPILILAHRRARPRRRLLPGPHAARLRERRRHLATGRDEARPRPQGGLRVEYQAHPGRRHVAGPGRHGGHQGHRRAPRQPDRRLRAGRRRPRAATGSSSSCPASPIRSRSAGSSARPAGSTSCRSARQQVQEGQVLDLDANPPLFSGDQVQSATVGTDQNGRPAVDFVLKGDGAKLFGDYTATHVGEYFAITLDGTVISAPVDPERDPRRHGQITAAPAGSRPRRPQNLVTVLKFGSLPFPIQELSSEQISATLGQPVPARACWPASSGSASWSRSCSSTTG